MKHLLKVLSQRIVLTVLALAIQVVLLVMMIVRFNDFFVLFYGASSVVSLIVVCYIINEKSNPGYKIAWIIPVLFIPIFGTIIYLLFGWSKLSRNTTGKMKAIEYRMKKELAADPEMLRTIHESDIGAYNQFFYLEKYAYCPVCENTALEYLYDGKIKLERMKQELEKAERFIFLEYFIIEPGEMWNSVLEILTRKVSEGVDVRLIYDDVGCIKTLPYGYEKQMERIGIKCCVFNKFIPILSSKLNNRDHRKICVIDGNVGITGGINLADEYINVFEKYGHWKDSSVLIKGAAVWNLTVLFLSMWCFLTKQDEDYSVFHPTQMFPSNGFVQPYGDNPLDGEPVGETVYLNMFSRANEYLYITTPYLIIDNEMVTSLINAAKSGVDVRIITPHIPDKWFVHAVTRGYYRQLIEGGVRIYEYTPGFIHAKTVVCDGKYATIGTINLDYRSLYLHFECGVFMYATDIISDMKSDFEQTLSESDEVTLEMCKSVPFAVRLMRGLLRVFAPLM